MLLSDDADAAVRGVGRCAAADATRHLETPLQRRNEEANDQLTGMKLERRDVYGHSSGPRAQSKLMMRPAQIG